jgi:FKBP-type peptidyl-prolyl cis-trans isomerase FklB
MKYFIPIALITLFCGQAFAADAPASKELDKVGYSIGYQVGSDLKRQGIEFNAESLLQGVQDAVSGNAPAMTPEEIQQTFVELKQKLMAAREKEMKEKGEKNLAEGKAFLAENAKKEGVVTLPSGLQYKIIKEGTGNTPRGEDTVTVNYRGTLINGSEFDSSYSRNEPATFRADRVIAGWREALQLMKEGAKWQLFIPPDLAYGDRGVNEVIGPNSTLIFEVELLSIQKGEPEATPEAVPEK